MYWSIGNNCTDFVSRENLSSAVRGWYDREYQRSSADQGNYKYNVIIFMLIKGNYTEKSKVLIQDTNKN